MSEITVDQISLNSVSKASTDESGNWVNDFIGNDIAFAHTTEEAKLSPHNPSSMMVS